MSVTDAALLRDGFGESAKFRVLIAEWEGQAAGYALFFDYYSTFEGRAGIFLEDLYVRESFAERELEMPCWRGLRPSPARKIALACAGRCSTGIRPRSISIKRSGLSFWMNGRP